MIGRRRFRCSADRAGSALLRYSPQFVRVIAEKLLIYALGRGTESYDMPLVRSIVHDAERNNYRFSSLIFGVVKSDAFKRLSSPLGFLKALFRQRNIDPSGKAVFLIPGRFTVAQ